MARRWLACVFPAAVFLAVILPTIPRGPVLGTGQDEWHNMARGLRGLHEAFNPGYFVHPALYYETLGAVYAAHRASLRLSQDAYLDRFLAREGESLGLARAVSVFFGALSAAAAAWLAGMLAGPGAGLLAGLLVAGLPLTGKYAVFIRVDSLALFCQLAALCLLLRRMREASRWSLALASIGIGAATAANYPAALLLGLPAFSEFRRDKAWLKDMLLACAVSFGTFMLLNPYVLIDLPDFLRWFSFQGGTLLTTHPHAEPPGAWRYLSVLARQGFFPAMALGAGVTALAFKDKELRSLAQYGVATLVLFALSRTQYDRFVIPGLVVLCCVGVAVMARGMERLTPRQRAAAIGLASILLTACAWNVRTHRPREGPDVRGEMASFVYDEMTPADTLILESDTLPLLQTAFDPGGGRFEALLAKAVRKAHPSLPGRIIKAQYIGGVYNYDPKLLEGGAYFLGSSLNRASMPEFYQAVDSKCRAVLTKVSSDEELTLFVCAQPTGSVSPKTPARRG
ncbi:MAG: hypothetical protein WC728_06460 [Elusimicrobiota bacterium]